MRRARGLSLIEVLIAMALAGIVLTLLVQIMIPGLQIWRYTQAMSVIEQNAMIAEKKLESTFLNTVKESVAVIDRSDLQAVSCMDNEGTLNQPGYSGTSAEIVWRSVAAYSLRPSQRELRFYRDPLDPPETTPAALTTSQLESITTGQGVLIADRVTQFRATTPTADVPTIQFNLILETNTPRGLQSIEREVIVCPRIQDL